MKVCCVSQLPRQVYVDGSSVAKKPVELVYLFSPKQCRGAYAAPVAGASLFCFCALAELDSGLPDCSNSFRHFRLYARVVRFSRQSAHIYLEYRVGDGAIGGTSS